MMRETGLQFTVTEKKKTKKEKKKGSYRVERKMFELDDGIVRPRGGWGGTLPPLQPI